VQRLDDLFERRRVHRLDQMMIEAGFVNALSIVILTVAGNCNEDG
jgi:hypothetical protein